MMYEICNYYIDLSKISFLSKTKTKHHEGNKTFSYTYDLNIGLEGHSNSLSFEYETKQERDEALDTILKTIEKNKKPKEIKSNMKF